MKLIFIVIVVALTVTGIGAYLGPDDFRGCGDRPTGQGRCQAADAIVAISGGDTAARTNEAIRLYQNGWAPELLFSGAAQDTTGPSNAAVMRDIALRAGVPSQNITIEEHGRTTKQNADETRALFGEKTVSSVILVTSLYHQRRASLEFKQSFNGIEVRNHPTRDDERWSSWWWTKPQGWYLALGEIAKILVLYLGGLRG